LRKLLNEEGVTLTVRVRKVSEEEAYENPFSQQEQGPYLSQVDPCLLLPH
jgi:hypothetical protein